MNTLIPNASTLEKILSEVLNEALLLDTDLTALIDPDRCPVQFLPFLAWARSVDYWDEDWPENTKRLAIKNAKEIHEHKGTVWAVEKGLEIIGYEIDRLIEWFEEIQSAAAGTFKMEVNAKQGIKPESYALVHHMIDINKPKSRHLTNLIVGISSTGKTSRAALCVEGHEISVYPYLPSDLDVFGVSQSKALVIEQHSIEVYPK